MANRDCFRSSQMTQGSTTVNAKFIELSTRIPVTYIVIVFDGVQWSLQRLFGAFCGGGGVQNHEKPNIDCN